MERQKYHISIRILHWVMALIILSLIAVGWVMAEYGEQLPNRMAVYNLHKSFGVLILILVAFRLVARITKGSPQMPEGIPSIVRKLARGAQALLYILIIAVPAVGYAMSNSFGYPVMLFGMPLPMLFPENKEIGKLLAEAHGILAYTMLVIVILHIAGAIKHRFFDKKENDVLDSMW